MSQTFNSLAEFYPFYLGEHANRTCRRLHFIGSSGGLLSLAASVVTGNFSWLLAGLVFGYAMAWVGHFFYEHNKPATFKYPFYSFVSDWVMYKEMLTGKIKF